MEKAPLVSVIVPVYNVEKYLDQCVGSLLGQTLDDMELILVDDCSTDRSGALCDHYARTSPRVRVHHQETNQGQGIACNEGLEMARGNYVAFCDSDDWVSPSMYQTMVDQAEATGSDAVCSCFLYVDVAGNPASRESLTYERTVLDTPAKIQQVMCDMIASAPAVRRDRSFEASGRLVLYRRDVIEKAGLRHVSERQVLSEDMIFNLDFFALCKKVALLPDKFYHYRANPASTTRRINSRAPLLNERLYALLCDKAEQLGLGLEGRQRVQRLVIGNARVFISRVCQASPADKKSMLKDVCRQPMWREIAASYPVSQMPMVHRVFFRLMAGGHITLLNIIAALHNRKDQKA